MAQKKLLRFAELHTMRNVLEHPQNVAGTWKNFFNNDNPVVLELACGKGEYTVSLAAMYPDKNYIGVDIKGNRIWVGARKALQQHLNNAAFLRIEIDKINNYFTKAEISEIWITFPDPQLRISKAKKRLTHPKFLRLYQQILTPGGVIHLKTDSPQLYTFTKKVCSMYNCVIKDDIEDVYAELHPRPELNITTHYERLDISNSKKVHYISFSLPQQLSPPETDQLLQEQLKDEALENISSEAKSEMKYEEEDDDELYSFNNNGLVIFTEEYLLQRGYCCGSGCKNCPYDYKAVPEPQRTILLAKRKNEQEKSSR